MLDEIETERRARVLDRARAEFRRRHGRDIAAPAELWTGPLRVLAGAPAAHPQIAGQRWVIDARAARSSRRTTGAATACTRIPTTRRSGARGASSRPAAAPLRRRRGGRDARRDRPRRRRDQGRAAGLRPAHASACSHDVTFCVREGEIFGFVGPNGAGKTTTLKILMGLSRATSGSARVLGHDVSETAFRRHVGFLPENPYFYDYLTGRETLDFYAKLCGLSRAQRRERAEVLLAQVGPRPRRGRARPHLQQGHAAAARDRAGARPRPRRRVPRRADERTRPDRAQGRARSDPARCASRARPCS